MSGYSKVGTNTAKNFEIAALCKPVKQSDELNFEALDLINH